MFDRKLEDKDKKLEDWQDDQRKEFFRLNE